MVLNPFQNVSDVLRESNGSKKGSMRSHCDPVRYFSGKPNSKYNEGRHSQYIRGGLQIIEQNKNFVQYRGDEYRISAFICPYSTSRTLMIKVFI